MRTRAIEWSPCWLALLLAGCDYLGLGGGRGPVLLSAPVIYLNQAAQNPDGSVALVAGRPALIRIFMVGDETSDYRPAARVTLFQEGTEVYSEVLAGAADRIPDEVVEADLARSVNGIIPGSVLQPGVAMVVQLDPEGLVPLAPGSRTRYPATGSTELNVVEPQLLRQVIVPTLEVRSPNESVYDWTDDLTPESAQVLLARTLMPVGSMELEVHDTYRTGSNLATEDGWSAWLREIEVLFLQEGRRGYYYGVAAVTNPAYAGMGLVGSPVSVGLPYDVIFAHELGHNMNLQHAPCESAGRLDPNYPYDGGVIGIWGYDPNLDQLLDPEQYKDVMGNCSPVWISDYNFSRATRHRLDDDGGVQLDGGAANAGSRDRGEMLVVWGSVRDGRVKLDPAFVLDGPPALPETGGPYTVEGLGPVSCCRLH